MIVKLLGELAQAVTKANLKHGHSTIPWPVGVFIMAFFWPVLQGFPEWSMWVWWGLLAAAGIGGVVWSVKGIFR